MISFEMVLKARDATAGALKKAQANMTKFRASVNKGFKGMLSGRKIMTGLAAGAVALGLTLKKSFEFERYRVQFKVLFGDLEQAKTHIASLQAFSASTPFQFADIAQASRQLHVFTNGVMGAEESLKLVGDAAAASGQNINDVAQWVGRAYSSIQAGRPFGEAAQRLQEMGILGGEARNKMEELQKSGASNIAVWSVLQGELNKSTGGMEEMSKTGEGLFSTLKDNWTLTLAAFGDRFSETAKVHIQALIEKLKSLQEDGSIDLWAARVSEALGIVGKAAKGAMWVFEKLAVVWGTVKYGVEGTSSGLGAMLGGGTFAEGVEMVDMPWEKEAEIRKKAHARKMKEATKEVATQEKSLSEKIAEDLGKKKTDAAKKTVEETAAAEAEKIAANLQKKLDQSKVDVENVATTEASLTKANLQKKLDQSKVDVENVATTEASLTKANLEEKKKQELQIVEEVAAARNAAFGGGGATGEGGEGAAAVDPNSRNYNLTAILQAEEMAKRTAQATAEAFRTVIEETNRPILDKLDRVAVAAERTADTLQDAITMSE